MEDGGGDARIARILPFFDKANVYPMGEREFGCGIRFVEFDEEAKAAEQSRRRGKQIADDGYVGAHDRQQFHDTDEDGQNAEHEAECFIVEKRVFSEDAASFAFGTLA